MPKIIINVRYYVMLIALLHLFAPSFSQSNEFNGYYLTPAGDTITGRFPGYKQWNYNPSKVNFINVQTGGRMLLTPANCKGFQIDGYDSYLPYNGLRMTNQINLNAGSSGNNTDTHDSISTFLRLIASSGKLKFYIYKDQLRINLYYSQNNMEMIELEQKAALINNSFWQSDTYKQQLKALFTDESKIKAIQYLNYSEESLSSFINNGKERNRSPNKVKNRNNGLIVSAGMSLNSLKFNQNRSMDFSTQSYPSNVAPLLQLGYIIALNRSFGKMFFLPQVTVFSFKHTGSTTYNDSYPVFSNTFKASPVISLGFHFGYNIVNTSNLKIALAPGGGFSFLVKNQQVDKAEYSATRVQTTTTSTEHTAAVVQLKAMAIVKNKFVIWSSYSLPTPVVTTGPVNGKLTAIQAGLGLKL